MRVTKLLTLALVTGAASLNFGLAAPAQARPMDTGSLACITPTGHDAAADARGRGDGDTRAVSPRQQRAIEKRTKAILREKGITRRETRRTAATVPVYVHKMLSSTGAGDVTSAQINAQVAELNQD